MCSLAVNASHFQGNILITPDGNACLGDFGIRSAFATLWWYSFRPKLGTARYMAPEQFDHNSSVRFASKESDIYSLAMTSFTVCPSPVRKESDTCCNHPVAIRSSQGYRHMMGFTTTTLSLPALNPGNDLPAQEIKM